MLDRKGWVYPAIAIFTFLVMFSTRGWLGVEMWAVSYGLGIIVGLFVGKRY